jgi:putative oxidoreductase
MKLFRLTLRLLIGGLFIGHGTQKLFGWFGGHGLDGTGGFFESLGRAPGKRNAIAAGVAEAGGGALLAGGVALPVAGAALTGTMTTAIRHVHAPKGPWTTDGGWEYNAVLIGATLAVVEDYCGLGWALGAGAAGVAGSVASSYLAAREAGRPEEAFKPIPFQDADTADSDQGQPTGGQTSAALHN